MKVAHRLRYYAPAFEAANDAAIRTLLVAIRAKWQIDHEVAEIPTRPGGFAGTVITDEGYEGELYERDFASRAALIKFRTGISVKKSLRSNKGNYYLRGTVAVISDSGVEWHSRGQVNFRNNDKDEGVGFLEAVLGRGPDLLAELCTGRPERRNAEQELTDKFIESGALNGLFQRQVKVGGQRFDTEFGPFDWRRRIDLVVVRDNVHWVIEAKVRLDHEAFGQALAYALLYAEERPGIRVRAAIVCAQVDAELLRVCSHHNVTVFAVGEQGVSVY